MSSYFITGTNRGIGLEMVKQLSALPESQVSTIFAATRSPSSALAKLVKGSNGRVVVVEVQITDRSSVNRAVKQVEQKLSGKGLDVLVNNAGVMPITTNGIETLETSTLQEAFEVNVIATQNVTVAFLPLLRRGNDKKIVNVSTTVGSITMTNAYSFAPTPAYKITKAALNSLTANYALELEKEGFTVFPVSPGWLKTELGSDYADLEVSVGVKATLDVILKEGREANGRFRTIRVPGWENVEGPNKYDGLDKPW